MTSILDTWKDRALREAAWETLRDRSDMTLEEFLRATIEWDFVEVRGGAVALHGPEIHACIRPNTFSRKILVTLKKVLTEYGYAITSVTVGNKAGESLVTKLGFHKIHLIGTTQYWRLDYGN